MKKLMLALAIGLIPFTGTANSADEPKIKPAKVTITAEVGCCHCDYGIGSDCAVCLKIDEKTPLLLKGKVTAELFPVRLKSRSATVEGTLSVDKDKRMVLTSDEGKLLPEK